MKYFWSRFYIKISHLLVKDYKYILVVNIQFLYFAYIQIENSGNFKIKLTISDVNTGKIN